MPATELMKGYENADAVVEAHRKRMLAIRGQLREAIEKCGHKCDEDLRLIDGKAAMVFILPSNDTVYIGFGPTGGRQAFRGLESDFKPEAAAEVISSYLKWVTPLTDGADTTHPSSITRVQPGSNKAGQGGQVLIEQSEKRNQG